MKPLILKFTAFGPYPDQQIVDFSQLQTSKMFVITGPTGSGKTTIFDAMSFALYGSASGSDRSTDMFRSDFAQSTVETCVEFEFIVKSKHFKIVRTPSQMRPKLRGQGLRKIDGTVTLTVGDRVFTAIAEVNEIIETELGLTKDQFKQIVLLPQGEFKKLLVSNSRDKEEIFRKIFNTAHIKQIQEQLRAESSELKRQIEDSQLQLNTVYSAYPHIHSSNQIRLFKTTTDNNVVDLQNKLTLIGEEHAKIEALIKLETDYQAQITQLTTVNTHLQQLESQADSYQLYGQFIEHIPLIVNVNNLNNQLLDIDHQLTTINTEATSLTEQLETENANFQQSQVKFEQKELEYQQLSTLEQQLSELVALVTMISNQLEIQTTIDNYLHQIEHHEQKLTIVNNTQLELETRAAAINDNIQLHTNNCLKLDQIKQEIEQVNNQITVVNQINQLKDQQKIDLELSNQLTIELNHQTTRLNHLREQFISAQAGTLALSLEPNQSCPVCGSLDHPHPARLNTTPISNQDIQDQEQITINLNQQLQSILNNIATNQALAQQLVKTHHITDVNYHQQLTTLTANHQSLLAINNSLEIDIDNLNIEIEKNTNTIIKINTEIETYKHTVTDLMTKISLEPQQLSQLPEYQTQIKSLKTTINQIEIEYQQAKNSNLQSAHKLETLNLELRLKQDQVITLMNKQSTLAEQLTVINNSIEPKVVAKYLEMLPNQAEIRSKYNKYVTDIALFTQQKQELEILVDDYQPVDINKLKVELERVTTSQQLYSQLSDDFKALATRLKTDLELITEIEQKTGTLINKYKLIADVSDVANGKTLSKISFERYMLAMYFKQIINRANIYFKTTTNNRFELEYKSPSSRKGAQGLDLNIIDNYTSKTRDVKSLSGGESFKAALSMALGLSDIVQMNSGGIQIDTILIDEGFGSLDTDSLNTAIDTLVGIESEGRMVGIISHVEELKNQIGNKIEITPSSSGSSLQTKFI